MDLEIQEPFFYGMCYCHSVKYRVKRTTKPFMAAYCHCESCRRAHSAPMYEVVYVPRDDYEIIEGLEYCKLAKRPNQEECQQNKKSISTMKKLEYAQKINEVEKNRRLCLRYFCTECGSRIKNDLVENNKEKISITSMKDSKEENRHSTDNLDEEKPLILWTGFFPNTLEFELQRSPLRPISFNPTAHYHAEETVLDLERFSDGLERK